MPSMHTLVALLSISGPAICAPSKPIDPYTQAVQQMKQFQEEYMENTINEIAAGRTTCTGDPLVRRAWDDLPKIDQQSYLEAVKCLATKPSKLDRNTVPGARDLRDDFTWTHITQTDFVHVSALLLPWHRHYIWLYESELNACGYTGALPYWPWERSADDLQSGGVFQADSFGGNGAYIPHDATTDIYVGLPPPGISNVRAAGTGGDCVVDGAFANTTGWTINLGPVSLSTTNDTENNQYGQQYNPRCLKRDFLQDGAGPLLNYTQIISTISLPNMSAFHGTLEPTLHRGSHGFIGKDGYDFFSSPQDPVFFLLHSQIDRIWALWQGQDYSNRKLAIDGTMTAFNLPPSANATLDSTMTFDVLGENKTIGQAVSTIENGYCYVYA